MKTCTLCGIEKPLSAFGVDKRKKDGHRARCLECVGLEGRERYWSNPEQERLRKRNFHHANKESETARSREYKSRTGYSRRYYENNKDRIRFLKERWRKENPDKTAAHYNSYRARLLSASHTLTIEQWNSILAEYEHCCAYCGERPVRIEMDHVVPLSQGGSHASENVVPACRSCNARKGGRTPEESGMAMVREA